MKAASISEIKKDLKDIPKDELLEICLKLVKYKKDNKELITYLLYEASNEEGFIQTVKEEIDLLFSEINSQSYYILKKSIRKILRIAKKNIQYSKKKETEIELLIHFCENLKKMRPSYTRDLVLTNLYNRQINAIHKIIDTLHEDLQYDFRKSVEEL